MTLRAFLNLLLWVWTASELVLLVLTRTRSGTGTVRDRGSLLLLWPVIVASITAGTWIGDSSPHTIAHGAPSVLVLALSCFLAGLVIRWTAIVSLGSAFSANVAIHATQRLRRTGLFRLVRHPSYSGLLLILLAIGLSTRNWLGLAIVVLPSAAALAYRIQVEEAALRRAFGSEYEVYCRSTKRLIPGLF